MLHLQAGVRLLALAVLGSPALAAEPADAPKVDYREAEAGSGWSATVPGEARERPTQPGPAAFTVRVFDDQRRLGPARRIDGELLATDVTIELEVCPDGNTRIGALRLGDWRYALEGSCADYRRAGRITVSRPGGDPVVESETESPQADRQGRLLRCEPDTLTCRSVTG